MPIIRYFLAVVLAFFMTYLSAQTVACNGNLNLLVDEKTCEVRITPDDIGVGGDFVGIEGIPDYALRNNMTDEVTILTDLVPELYIEGEIPDLRYNLYVGTPEIITNSCWGTFKVTDESKTCQLSDARPLISGTVFHDENANGTKDGEEYGLANVKLMQLPDSSFTFTANDGSYALLAADGPNEVTMLGVDQCSDDQQSFEVNMDTVSFSYEEDFAVENLAVLSSAAVSIESGPTRCGFTVPFFVYVTNSGCLPLSGEVHVDMTELVFFNDGPVDLTFNVTDLQPKARYVKKVLLRIASEEFVSDSLSVTAVFQNEETTESSTYKSEIRCAIDPNDKQVSSVYIDVEDDSTFYSLFRDEVIYKIRFQNEGNDTAFNIRVEDTLSSFLDLSTFRPIATSHDYRIEVRGNALAYYFDNILLPWKEIDEPGSNGFFTFGIRPRDGLQELTEVENTAFIYFDFNKPVITNTVKHRFVEEVDADRDGYFFWDDCDDENAELSPGSEDIPYNDIDENCDGVDAEIDLDEDGFNSLVDCNDEDATVNPEAEDIPYNDVDENCDGEDAIIDVDNDGFNSQEDCDDQDAAINPEAEDIPYNDVDENCDGIDAEIDLDQDGFNSLVDCNDEDAAVNPEAEDIPYNDVDENCDGEDAFIDVDNDGFNSLEDCDDEDASINPGSTEIVDNDVDENCDGVVEMTSSIYESLFVKVNVSPNPAEDILIVDVNHQGGYDIALYSLTGRLLIFKEDNRFRSMLDVSRLDEGIYFLKHKDVISAKISVIKVVIQR